jgi:hypothetical protein
LSVTNATKLELPTKAKHQLSYQAYSAFS